MPQVHLRSDTFTTDTYDYATISSARAGYRRFLKQAIAAHHEDGIHRTVTLVLEETIVGHEVQDKAVT